MNPSALLDWLDDRINPIVIKELRQAVKSRLVVSILMLFLGVQLFLLGVFLMFREARVGSGGDWDAGSSAFMIQQGILIWTIGVLVPSYAAIRMGAERLDKNVDLMFISTLRPRSIVWGKFAATLLLGLLVFSTCAPFMTFTYLLRGIDIPTIFLVLGIDLLLMLFGIMVALFLASLPGAWVLKFVYSFVGFMGLVFLTGTLTGGTIALIEGSAGFFDWLVENWPVTVSMVAGVFALIGLLFCYTTGVIAPPSSNRLFGVRVFLLGLCAVTLTGAMISSFTVASDLQIAPIIIFLMIVIPILCLQMWISICERDRWGPRMMRSIPNNRLLRPLAFLFYTGSAGGMIYSTILTAFCLMVCAARVEMYSGRNQDIAWRFLMTHLLVAMYALCYGQSAVLIRRYLLSDQVRVGYTWVIAGLLVGVGTTVPPIFAYFAYSDQMRTGVGIDWWYVPNPFMGYLNAFWEGGTYRASRFDEFDVLCLWFLLTWMVILVLLSLRWMVDQVQRFHPPLQKQEEFAEVVLLEAEPSVEAGA